MTTIKIHRCKGSLEQHLSIRYNEDKNAWTISRYINDWDYDTDYYYEDEIAKIKYCPCCGKRLEE